MFVYCLNNPINMVDVTGELPKWVSNTLKIAAGVAVVATGVALTALTFGAAAPLTVVVTAAAIGTVGGAATNAAIQYSKTNSWDNFQVDECITAGVSGGLSAILSTTPIGIGGQMIGNALISGGNSLVNGNSVEDVLLDTGIGALAGFVGGPGSGRGGFVLSEALRNKRLINTFLKGYVKSSFVSNTRNIIGGFQRNSQKFGNLLS